MIIPLLGLRPNPTWPKSSPFISLINNVIPLDHKLCEDKSHTFLTNHCIFGVLAAELLLSTQYYVLGTVVSPLHALIQLIITTILWDYYCSHSTDAKIKYKNIV